MAKENEEDENDEKYWIKLEKIFVHDVYENITTHCANTESNHDAKTNGTNETTMTKSTTNGSKDSSKSTTTTTTLVGGMDKPKTKLIHKPWPKVKSFLRHLEPYSLVADIGCGDGKYLNIDQHLMTIGCDHSLSLCNMASAASSQPLVVADNLTLPFRCDLFDAVISIGVIHHFSTRKRRVQAISELARILRPGGQLMICVWAMEQRMRKFNSQDVLVPMLNPTISRLKHSEQQKRIQLSRDSSCTTSIGEDSNDDESKPPCLLAKSCDDSQSLKTSFDSTMNEHSDYTVNLKTKPVTAQTNGTFATNVKQFFRKRFSSSNLRGDEQADLEAKPASTDETFDPVRRCHRIIEDYKALLPKEFSMRRFPFSSYSTTFDKSDQDLDNQPQQTGNSENDNHTKEKEAKRNHHEDDDHDNKNTNASNKRYYHVFKINELNELISSECPSLVQVDSSNYHGNWYWIGTKNLDESNQ